MRHHFLAKSLVMIRGMTNQLVLAFSGEIYCYWLPLVACYSWLRDLKVCIELVELVDWLLAREAAGACCDVDADVVVFSI